MERYAPNAEGPRVSRDVVSRAMTVEIREGRGVGALRTTSTLHLEHLGARCHPRAAARHRRDRAHLCRRRCHASSRSRCCRPSTTTWAAFPATVHGEVVTAARRRSGCIVAGSHGRRRGGVRLRCTVPTASASNSLLDLVIFGREAARRCARSHQARRAPPGVGQGCRGAALAARSAAPRRAASAAPRRSASRCKRPCSWMRRCFAPGSRSRAGHREACRHVCLVRQRARHATARSSGTPTSSKRSSLTTCCCRRPPPSTRPRTAPRVVARMRARTFPERDDVQLAEAHARVGGRATGRCASTTDPVHLNTLTRDVESIPPKAGLTKEAMANSACRKLAHRESARTARRSPPAAR